MVVYSTCHEHAPPNRRAAMAEFLTRASYGMIIGNFELDFEDGEIRYRSSLDFSGSRLDLPLLRTLLYVNVTVMDQYLPGIHLILAGEVSPREVIARIEAAPH